MSFSPLFIGLMLQSSLHIAAPPPPKIPPATIDDSLEITGDAVEARKVRSRMYVSVQVNGTGPYRFLVDSGADRSVIGETLAQQLKLEPGPVVKLQSVAGASQVTTVLVDHIKVGSSDITDIAAPALPERFIGAQGLLGIDALADQRLMLDFDKKTITIQDSRRPAETLSDEIVVTARKRNGQLILTRATAAGVPIYAVLDTGSEVTVGNSALQARIFGKSGAPARGTIELISVTGEIASAQAATLPEVKLGGIKLRGVAVAFADLPPFRLFGLDKQPALLLGSDTLEAFKRVSLDFRARKVRFVLRR